MEPIQFQTGMTVPKPLWEVFTFFSDATNLHKITPGWLDFTIVSPLPKVMAAGALIDYRLRVHGFRIRWQTEIAVWEPPYRFEDRQRRGPYRLWVHEHLFEERDGGTYVSDYVRYLPPGGRFIDWLFVRRDVHRIFKFRQERLAEIFRA